MTGSESAESATSTKASLWKWMVGFVGVLVVGGAAVFFLWPQEQSPAQVLPAVSTSFVIHGATEDRINLYRSLFPVLSTAQAGTERSTLAIVDSAWVLFEPRLNRAEALIEGDTDLGAWTITSSNPNPE